MNRKMVYIAVLVSVIAASLGITISSMAVMKAGEKYSVSERGIISYSNRPPVIFTKTLYNKSGNVVTYKIMYKSHDATIYGLLSIPKSDSKVPAFFLLPGATVTKEGEQSGLGKLLNSMGYATLSIDQRSYGETGGYVPDIKEDFGTFLNRGEPVQHKMIYDGLRAFDVLNSLNEIDRNRIYAGGESMGGRFAIIDTAIEPGIRGVLVISSSGYGLPKTGNRNMDRFLASIDPDNYIGMISPRPIVMIHSENDYIVPISAARRTFSLAGEPKEFFTITKRSHAYVKEMDGIIREALRGW